jgi:hypothetical protein
MSVPSVLVQKSTKSILKFADYPRLEVTPFLEGEIDPDLEWLVVNIPFPEPDYDPRIYILGTNIPNLDQLETFPDHPLYSGIKAYQITYTPERRSNEAIIVSIDNAEKEANNLIWSEGVHKDKMLLMLNASAKAATGALLNEEEEILLNDMNAIAVKLSKNKDNRNILVDQVIANQVPNIDAGWESAE